MGGFIVGVMEVWMVRHTAVDAAVGTCYGRTDVPLRESFADEAEAVRRALAGERFDAVFTSPLSRCLRLAEACGYGATAVRDERLREIDFGAWEGRLYDEIDDPALQAWYADWLHARPTGGETFDEQRARVAEFLEELHGGGLRGGVGESDGRRVLVFTHGGVVVAAGIHAGLWSAEDAFSHTPPYGGIIKLVYGADRR
jgi:alpha-ribazole phosphatase